MPTPEYYQGKETINKQEYAVRKLIAYGMEPARAFDAATAMKYVDRAGDKPGEESSKDIEKAVAYLFRVKYGVWPWEIGEPYEA